MKKSILTLLLAAMSTGAMAEWVKVGEIASGTVFYIDPATMSKDGNFRKVWEVQDLKQRGKSGEISMRGFLEYDCKKERSRILSVSGHSDPMAGGKTVASHGIPDKWYDVTPGTIPAAELKFVCSK